MASSVCVVGAGVIGLTTATLLQDALPAGSLVTLVADKFTTDTTSDGAAGIFRPGKYLQGPSEQMTKQWLEDSYKHYKKILNSEDAAEAGVKAVSGYLFSNKDPKIIQSPLMKEIIDEYRECTQDELDLHDQKYGTFCTTLVIQCRRMLPYLMDRFKRRGGVVRKQHVNSLEELADEGCFDLVCNCSGLGASVLANDRYVTPIRGQVFKVRAPWIKNFYYHENDTYIIPGMDMITLGGTRQFDNDTTDVSTSDASEIWRRCVQLLPSLKDAEVLRQWVGLRPYRPSVRVEKELMKFGGGKTLKVVHHYGHGGYGVMSAPGSSMYAVSLICDFLQHHQHHRAKL
ncbi:hypothetical protein Pmani_012980 [Petrolisthes manimaculis]|uniref:FAD dependent oxidoreductase domain-containing protein n=1 Tax=Petrolisthes manimaculis TaxID=1843537 RepID=A0AAE1PYC8_9EUCA|nr:hypothetical protein Pmani_012980 [Petrolisthes manimaculis]